MDEGYRTGLGTRFYNRRVELEKLERLMENYVMVLIYGPRGVGKSELLRYYAVKRLKGGTVVIVDARRLRAKAVEEAGRVTVVSPEASELARRLVESLGRGTSILDLALTAFDIASELLGRRRRILVALDEFHLLPRYTGRDIREALADLEALAGLLSKEERYSGLRLALTVSEGFAATPVVRARLRGYRAAWMLVEHLDKLHFEKLCLEYSERHGCRIGCCEVEALVGGTPGYLPLLCNASRDAVEGELVRGWLLDMEAALGSAAERLEERGSRPSTRDLLEAAYTVMIEGASPLREPRIYSIAEALVEHNVIYPLEPGGMIFKPVYPVYRVIVEVALRKGGVEPVMLNPSEVYRKAVESAGCRV